MPWSLKESGDQLPMGVVTPTDNWPPISQGEQGPANLFWWSALQRVCVVVHSTRVGDDGDEYFLELWVREPGDPNIWSMRAEAQIPDIGFPFTADFSTGHILAAVDSTEGGSTLILCAYDCAYQKYWFFQVTYNDPDFVWSLPAPGITDGFNVEGDGFGPSFPPRMCAGTSGDPRPRLLGRFFDGGGYGFYSASYNPTWPNGLYLHECSVPSERNHFAMEYDPIRDTIVIFGGHVGSLSPPDFKNDVWEGSGLTGAGFSEVPWSGDGPGSRTGVGMCHDGNGMLIYGGYQVYGPSLSMLGKGGWRWDGTTWTPAYGVETNYDDPIQGGWANNHFFRFSPRMAFDRRRAMPVIFRGKQGD